MPDCEYCEGSSIQDFGDGVHECEECEGTGKTGWIYQDGQRVPAPPKKMRHVVCWECEGKGWHASIGASSLPEQETCHQCKGKKTMFCTEEFFQGMGNLQEVETDE